jgi:D-glycero-D-manno-heptose 1,7-bisphosphate phosphatase
MKKCVFLDRDGVLNVEIGDYITKDEQLIFPDIKDDLKVLKDSGFLLIVATNQGGIDRGLYSREWVFEIHERMQQEFGFVLDELYFTPHHPSLSKSYLTKPASMMFEKGIAKFGIDPTQSWMIGDKERDMIPAKSLGMRCILLNDKPVEETVADYVCRDFSQATRFILSNS